MRAFVYVWLWLAQVPPAEAQGKSAESWAILPFPSPAIPPHTPLPGERPPRAGAGNSCLFLSTRGPAGRAWGLGADLPGSLPTRERGPTRRTKKI